MNSFSGLGGTIVSTVSKLTLLGCMWTSCLNHRTQF